MSGPQGRNEHVQSSKLDSGKGDWQYRLAVDPSLDRPMDAVLNGWADEKDRLTRVRDGR